MLHVNKFPESTPGGLVLSTPAGGKAGSGARSPERLAAITVYDDLESLEHEWRAFEQFADCTPFQSFDWLSNWQNCIGAMRGVRPVIIAGRGSEGDLLFLLPLAIEKSRLLKRLVFLGREFCDYNAPLLAPDLHKALNPSKFVAEFQSACGKLQSAKRKFDFVFFDKMPERVGRQANPLCALVTTRNASGAHSTKLEADWEKFYTAKRSSSTRRGDRTKHNRLCNRRYFRPAPADFIFHTCCYFDGVDCALGTVQSGHQSNVLAAFLFGAKL
jgi:CelD/BcsL family acetyltransferase involved in cellulose biosynthesis